jgi:microcystin-dependent protein
MSEPFIGQIIMFGGNFAPRGWAFCDGALLAIAQNSALFSILGTTYGGDGRTTFGLPDLRGRYAMHEGQGPGLSPRALGSRSGSENTTLTINNLPNHRHRIRASGDAANTSNPDGNRLALSEAFSDQAIVGTSPALNDDASDAVGGGQAFTNMPPYQVVNFIIALQGIFPSRN